MQPTTVHPAELDGVAEGLVVRLGWAPTVAVGRAKQAIHYGQDATLPQTMNQELFNLELCCRTTDFKESLAAFREERPPQLRGR
jgi:2-(1,2-epoxy-1,2-dihydrophenyl)acetyl-CoA isomerase